MTVGPVSGRFTCCTLFSRASDADCYPSSSFLTLPPLLQSLPFSDSHCIHTNFSSACPFSERKMGGKLLKAEASLRLSSFILASLTALLLGLDSETENVFFKDRKATSKQLSSLWVLVIVSSITAGYQLLQLCKCFAYACLTENSRHGSRVVAWIFFLLDQMATYATFTGTMAATQGSAIAVFGVGHMQWAKLCNIYTRFCEQIGGGLLCGLLASLALAAMSSVSAYHLFQPYPSRPAIRGHWWGLL